MDDKLIRDFKGLFIAIDGQNGVGKSTIINSLLQILHDDLPKHDIIKITEPSTSKISSLVREFSELPLHNYTLLYLVAADREYNHVQYLRPILSNPNAIVISDRYFSSSLVYQRMHGLAQEDILSIHRNIYIPDILFYISADKEIIKQRLQSERSSNLLFENPKNVEQESDYFLDSMKYLSENGYNVVNVFNDSLEVVVSQIAFEIKSLAENKSRK